MKDSYHISEISKLYGVGVDSLRYYERLGVLRPKRDVNGYRLYSLKDIYKLNIIRDLRQMGFSMRQIKRYLEDRTVDSTIRLLAREKALLQEQRRQIRAREAALQARMMALREAMAMPAGQMRLLTLPERRCVRLNEHITRDEEMDFVIKKPHHMHENKIHDFGSLTIGACLSPQEVARGVCNVFTSVFFILDSNAADCDFALPAGLYLSSCYRGGYAQNGACIARMQAYARREGLSVLDAPFELYRIDNHDTAREEEFCTEVQMRVRADGDAPCPAARDVVQ